MYLRRCYRARDGKRHAYWALVKSERTARGPRQRVVAYLGDLDEAGRLGVQAAADGGGGGGSSQPAFFDSPPAPRYVEVDLSAVRVDGTRSFGGTWLALQLIGRLGLKSELDRLMPGGREDVPWSIMPLVLVNPSLTPAASPVVGPEGCLSFPEIYAEIARPESVHVVGINGKGERVEFRCGGLLARAVQHETDHLNGILFIDRMDSQTKQDLKPELEELQAASPRTA